LYLCKNLENMYQLCPKCGGSGKIPPEPNYESTAVNTLPRVCPLCRGEFVIDETTGLPPSCNTPKMRQYWEAPRYRTGVGTEYRDLYLDQACGVDSTNVSKVAELTDDEKRAMLGYIIKNAKP